MADCNVLTDGVPCILGQAAGAVIPPVVNAIQFGSDPTGYLAQKLQTGANGLATGVLPAMNEATQPDLSTEWFVSTYKVSFALAILVWVVLLVWNLVQYSRRQVSGDELLESLTVYSPIFIAGAMFGPVVGQLMLRFVGALTDGLISWGIAKTAATTTKGISTLIAAGDPNAMMGGSVVAIGMYFFMIIGLLLAFLMLLIMAVTLYLSGVVFPLGWVWVTKARDRSKGHKIVMVWAGVLFAQPLLFLLLGFALNLSTGSVFSGISSANPSLKTLVGLAVAVIALLMATMSPAMLLRFAPVGPTEAAPGGPIMSQFPTGGRSPGSGRGGAGEESGSNGQLAQVAQNNAQRGNRDAQRDGMGGSEGGPAAGGGLTRQVGAGSGGGAGGAVSVGGAGATGGSAAAGAEAGAAGGPVGMLAGAAAAGVAAKVKDGADQASAQAGDAAGSVVAGGSETPGGTGDPGEESTASSSTSPSTDVAPNSTNDSTGAPSLSGASNSNSDPGSAERSSDGSGDGGSWSASSGDPVAGDDGPVVGAQGDAESSGGGWRHGLGQVASVAGGLASMAAKTTNTVAGIAQQAAGFAEEHMDHHKDGPRVPR